MAALAGTQPARPDCVQQLDALGIGVAVHDSAAELLASLPQERIVICALHTDSEQAITLATQLSGRPNVGVLALGPAGDVDTQVRSLLLGADSWLSEQAPPALIAATVYALFRRISMAEPRWRAHACSARAHGPPQGWRIEDDGWLLVAPGGGKVRLTRRERDLLILLALEAGTVVSRESLAQGLSATGMDIRPDGVNMLVSRLRRKARRTGEELPVITGAASRGYLLEVPLPGLPKHSL